MTPESLPMKNCSVNVIKYSRPTDSLFSDGNKLELQRKFLLTALYSTDRLIIFVLVCYIRGPSSLIFAWLQAA